MAENSLTPEEAAENAKGRYKVSVARLQDELDHLIKIFAHMRESFENEMMDGLGYKKLTVTDRQMKQGASLSKMMTELVACKVRYDKAAKTMADSMTAEEERGAVLKYLQSLSAPDRKDFLGVLRQWMKARNEVYYDRDAGKSE